ncbi:hypothetical protein GCM10009101_31010 [Brevundimonas lenta]
MVRTRAATSRSAAVLPDARSETHGCSLTASARAAARLERLDFGALSPILVLFGFARTMAINVPVISGPDPGAIPGGSTILSRLSAGERGAD